jgi:hypothetical protein
MSTRTRLATIPLDNGSDLVVSLTADGDADVRLWTRTGDLKFPSKDGVSIPHYAVHAVIDALKQAKRRTAA